MRVGCLVVLLGLLGGASAARADVVASTGAAIDGVQMSPCSSFGSTQSSCNSSASSLYEYASASASGEQFGGIVSAIAVGNDPTLEMPKPAIGQASILIDGEYALYGGTGTGSIDLNYQVYLNQGPGYECSVVIDGGNAQSCNDPVIVEYGVPFIMDVELSVYAVAGLYGEGVEGQLSVDFSQPGLYLVNPEPAPEPSSVWLLMPGLFGVLVAARSRFSSRDEGVR